MAALLNDDVVVAALRDLGIRLDDIDRVTLGGQNWDREDADYLLLASPPSAAPVQGALFTSPLVLHARPRFAEALAGQGLLQPEGGRTFVDTAGLLRSAEPFLIADPTESDAAWLFAGLAVTVLGGGEAAEAALRSRIEADDDLDWFMDEDPSAAPARIGLEADLLAWIAADPGRWARLQASSPDAAPITLHLRPTTFATYAFVGVRADAPSLADALLSPRIQRHAALQHGLRGPQRQSAAGETFQAGARLPPAPTMVAPLPDRMLVQSLAKRLSD